MQDFVFLSWKKGPRVPSGHKFSGFLTLLTLTYLLAFSKKKMFSLFLEGKNCIFFLPHLSYFIQGRPPPPFFGAGGSKKILIFFLNLDEIMISPILKPEGRQHCTVLNPTGLFGHYPEQKKRHVPSHEQTVPGGTVRQTFLWGKNGENWQLWLNQTSLLLCREVVSVVVRKRKKACCSTTITKSFIFVIIRY